MAKGKTLEERVTAIEERLGIPTPAQEARDAREARAEPEASAQEDSDGDRIGRG